MKPRSRHQIVLCLVLVYLLAMIKLTVILDSNPQIWNQYIDLLAIHLLTKLDLREQCFELAIDSNLLR